MYENTIQQERYYIPYTTLECNLFYIHRALSSARNFELSIKIEYKPNNCGGCNISFNTFEWLILSTT